MPGSRANIDHLCVGPGGVTVIDAKRYVGKVRVKGGRLLVGTRDRTRLIEGVSRQVDAIRSLLLEAGYGGVDVGGAICWVESDGLPLIRRMELQGVRIDGARRLSKFASRPGSLPPDEVAEIAACIRYSLGR